MLVWGLGAGAVPTWGCGQGGAGAGAEHGGPLVLEPLCVGVAGGPAAARLGCAGQQDKCPRDRKGAMELRGGRMVF